MSWKNFFIGERVPDKDDPQYKERYERDKAAGESFARMTGLSTLGAVIHRYASAHKVGFLVLVFGFVISLFVWNVVRMVRAYNVRSGAKAVAVERVDSAMKHRGEHHSSIKMIEKYE